VNPAPPGEATEPGRRRQERLGDAAIFFRNKIFADLIERFIREPSDEAARERLLDWLGRVHGAHHYDRVFFLDASGVERLAVPATPESVEPHVLKLISEILHADRIEFLDFHRDSQDRPIHLAILVPIVRGRPGGRPLGVLALRIDPTTYLYPFIQRWPTPSVSAETLLVRREGNEALFLNELRFQSGTALSLRISVTKTDVPAVRAVLGREGIAEGIDYRGVPVIADTHPIPDSPWFLVARMDLAEVTAPLRERWWLMLGLVGALLFGAGAAALGFWRRQKTRYFQERYETAKKLHAVSARQEALLSAIPDIIMEVDAAKEYVWANPAGLGFFGEDVVGREASFYFEGEQETYRTVQPLFNGQENVIYVESWQRRKDGAKRLLAWWCRVLKDGRGRVMGALSSGRDITEQKRAEEEISKKHLELQDSIQQLERSRNLLNLIIESIPVRVFWKDKDLRYLGCNSLFAQDAGFSRPQELLGKDDFAMGWKDQADLYRMDDRQVMESRRPKINIIEPQTTPTGATIWLSTSKVPLQNPEGEVFGVVGVYEDITERKRAEEELRRSEAFLGSVIDNSPLAMWVSDENGTMIRMNQALGKPLHITEDEVVGKYNVLRDDIVEKQGAMPRVREVFARGETAKFPLEYDTSTLRQLKFADRAAVVLDVTISAVKGVDGRVTNAVIQLVDITERVKAEEALRASLKEKEVLLREIHHRVKNDMQVISSLLNLQGAQIADPAVKEVFRESQLRIRSMALVHERLYGSGDLSRIDFAEYLRKLSVHLGQAFAVAAGRIEARFDLEEISLDINSAIPCGLIATELISNAMKHAFPEDRRGTIVVALKRADDGRIRLTIADDGVGFPPEIDFRKTESLGMQIVTMLSHQIEGEVELAGGSGTKFSVTFPETLYKKRL